jgi:hypothetical protein
MSPAPPGFFQQQERVMKLHKRDKGRLASTPRCPTCDTVIDGFTVAKGGENAVPKNGDASICAYCGTAMLVQGEKFVKMTARQLEFSLMEPHFKLAYEAVKALRRERQS